MSCQHLFVRAADLPSPRFPWQPGWKPACGNQSSRVYPPVYRALFTLGLACPDGVRDLHPTASPQSAGRPDEASALCGGVPIA